VVRTTGRCSGKRVRRSFRFTVRWCEGISMVAVTPSACASREPRAVPEHERLQGGNVIGENSAVERSVSARGQSMFDGASHRFVV